MPEGAAPGGISAAAGPAGQVQVLITSDDTPVGGYDAVIADPDGLVATRYGLRDGGRVVVRARSADRTVTATIIAWLPQLFAPV